MALKPELWEAKKPKPKAKTKPTKGVKDGSNNLSSK